MSCSDMKSLPGGIVPIKLSVCRICSASNSKMYSMTTYKILNNAYENVIGMLLEDTRLLSRSLCAECARRVLDCARFRCASLRAHLELMDAAKTHGFVTDVLSRELR